MSDEYITANVPGRWIMEKDAEITRLRAENERLRAALAQSELPCVYCSLPKNKWGECKQGFPGCGRADDAMGCPELGARLRADALQLEVDKLKREAICRVDQITREQDTVLETIADYNDVASENELLQIKNEEMIKIIKEISKCLEGTGEGLLNIVRRAVDLINAEEKNEVL